MMTALPRRGFLRGLASLPLIGGGVTLIGRPTAAAVPVTGDLLQSYKSWLFMEHRMLALEGLPPLGRRTPPLAPSSIIVAERARWRIHF